jgi:hypothetical protein
MVSGAASSSESGGTSRDAATSAASARGACRRAARTAASPPRRRGGAALGSGARQREARGARRGARGAGAADLARRDHGLDDEPHPLLHCGVVRRTPRQPAAQLRAARRAHRALTLLRARRAGCAGRAACAYLTSGSLGGEALVQRREHFVVAQRVRHRLPAARGDLAPRPARLSAPSGAVGGWRGDAAAGRAASVIPFARDRTHLGEQRSRARGAVAERRLRLRGERAREGRRARSEQAPAGRRRSHAVLQRRCITVTSPLRCNGRRAGERTP